MAGNNNAGALKNFVLVLVGIILGIVLTLGSIAGFGYYAYKNYKMEKINQWTGKEYFGKVVIDGKEEDLSQKSLSEFLQFIEELKDVSSSLSLNDLDNMFPALKISSYLDNFIKDGKFTIKYNGSTVISIDEEEFKNLKFNKIASEIVDNAKSSVSLTTLEAMDIGIKFSDIPYIVGQSKSGEPIFTYVNIGSGQLDDYYIVRSESLYYKEEDGSFTKVPASDIGALSASGSALKAADEKRDIYYKAQGFMEMPLNDAFSGIMEALDFDKLTLAIAEVNFGLNFKEEDGSYNNILLKLKDKSITELSQNMTEIINELYLSDVMDIEGSRLETIKYMRYSELTAQEYNKDKPESEWVEAGDYILIDGEKQLTKVNEINSQLDCVKIADLVKNYKPGENALVDEFADLILGELTSETVDEKVKGLSLSEVLGEIDSDSILYNLQFKRFTEATAAQYNDGKDESEWVKAGDKVPGKEGGYVYATIEELSSTLNYIPLGEIIGKSGNAVADAMSEVLVKDLSSQIDEVVKGLSLDAVLGGIEEGSAFASLKYLRYTEESAAQYNEGKPESERVKAGDFVICADGEKVLTKVSEIQSQIDYVRVGDLVQGEGKIFDAVKDSTVKDLGNKINNLTLEDIFDVSSSTMLEALSVRKYTAEEAAAAGKNEGDIMYEADGVTPVKTKIEDLSSQLDYITLNDVFVPDENSSQFIKNLFAEVGGYMLKDMDEAFENAKISSVLQIDRDGGGNPTGIWYFVFLDEQTGTLDESITFGSMDETFSELPSKIAGSTLGTLCDKGILDIPNLDPDIAEYTLIEFVELINDNWDYIKTVIAAQ